MEKVAYRIYMFVLLVSPILFGAVHTYAYTLMSFGILTASFLVLISNFQKEPQSGSFQLKIPRTSLNFMFVVLLIFMVIQIIPLPASLIKTLSPEAWNIGQNSLPASRVVEDSISKDWLGFSQYYYPVRMSIVRFCVYALFFLGFIQLLNSTKRIENTVLLILLLCCVEAIYGLVQTFSGSGYILWYKKSHNMREITGTYINRNHFAGLMAMGMSLAAAYTAALFRRSRSREQSFFRRSGLRARFLQFLSEEQRLSKRTWSLFCGVTLGIGLIFSASRGGIIGGAGALLCMGMMFFLKTKLRPKGYVLLVLFLIISVYALHMGVEYPVERFERIGQDWTARERYAQKTMDLFADYRLFGVGIGNFVHAYPKYQSEEDKKGLIRHAHNDWAQFLAEAGLIGLVLMVAGISGYIFRTISQWKKRNDSFTVCLGTAPFAALTAMAIHSFADFNLHIPANFLMLVAIMAIGYSALYLDRHREKERLGLQYNTINLNFRGFPILIFIAVLFLCNGFWSFKHFLAECYCNTVTNNTMKRDQDPPLHQIRAAIWWDKPNARYWFKLAKELIKIRDAENREINERQEKQREIIHTLEQAVWLNPFDSEYHFALGLECANLWEIPDEWLKWRQASDLSIERAAYTTGNSNPYHHRVLGHYWVMRSEKLLRNGDKWKQALAKARKHYRISLSLETGHFRKLVMKEISDHIELYYPDEELAGQIFDIEKEQLKK